MSAAVMSGSMRSPAGTVLGSAVATGGEATSRGVPTGAWNARRATRPGPGPGAAVGAKPPPGRTADDAVRREPVR